MTADRIPCINPVCRRTVARDQHAESYEICCGKCWKLLPKALTRRYRALRARDRKIERIIARMQRRGRTLPVASLNALGDRMDRMIAANWIDIRNFFRPADKPAGLGTFLEEIGL